MKRKEVKKKGREKRTFFANWYFFPEHNTSGPVQKRKANRENKRHASHYRSDPFALGGISFPDNSRKKRVPRKKK